MQTLQKYLNAVQIERSDLHLYALADPAQQKKLPSVISILWQTRCLFTDLTDSDIAHNSPHLVAMPPFYAESKPWQWIAKNAPVTASVTVIASHLDFETLFCHLQKFIEIKLPDKDELFFAFWDPAILGTLIGQKDDSTLNVAGPVLTTQQRQALFANIDHWWYWDRESNLHEIDCTSVNVEPAPTPFALTQAQVDALVEASIPDQVLYYISLNQPQLVSDIAPIKRYRIVRDLLMDASHIKLFNMTDLVNYVCAALIYQEQFKQDETIRALLERVKNGDLTFPQALEQFP